MNNDNNNRSNKGKILGRKLKCKQQQDKNILVGKAGKL